MTKKPEPEDFGIPRDDLPRWHLEAPRRRGRAAAVIAGLIVLVSVIGCSGFKGGLIVGLLPVDRLTSSRDEHPGVGGERRAALDLIAICYGP